MSRLTNIFKRTVIGVVVAVIALFIVDYAVLRAKVTFPKLGAATGTVQMTRIYAIPQKNGRVEYQLDANQPEVTMPCVHSLFPHMGKSPCWYLQQNATKPIPVVILPALPH
ncbi:MAG TPA: hypothetical protein VGJ06_05970 [Candidatus Acidoferrum sp.]|jgi:hypothetical protein